MAIALRDANDNIVNVPDPSAPGRAAAAGSKPVVLSNEDKGVLDNIATALGSLGGYTDGLEGLITLLNGYVDNLEGYTDGLEGLLTTIRDLGTSFEAVGAGQSSGVTLGGSGAAGDILSTVLIIPLTTSPGAVQIQDGGGTPITIFPGGASSVNALVPFSVALGIKSTAGAWKLITNANVAALATGNFT